MHRIESPRRVEFHCPNCNSHIQLPLRRAYKQHRCPACDEAFFVMPVHERVIEPIPADADQGSRSTAA